MLILEDAGRADALADAQLAGGYRGLTRAQMFIGGVDDAIREIGEIESLGFDEVIVRCMSANQDVALETIACLGAIIGEHS